MTYIFELMPALLSGLVVTLKVFGWTLILSVPLGIVVALGRLSKIKAIGALAQWYIYIMRGTPLLLQLVFIFFGLPTIGVTLGRMPAAITAFVLNYGAYFGEIFRGGIESIDSGQYEAAEMLGMDKKQTFSRIILPQVVKRTLPAVGNEVITLVKDTALIYVVGISELLRAGKIAANRDVTLLPLLAVGVIYLIITALMTNQFRTLEEKYAYYQ